MNLSYDIEERRREKMRSDDRILSLSIIDGKKPLSSIGQVDNRLFKGENRLHAYRDDITGLWKFRYDEGAVPGALKQSFVTFDTLLAHAKKYFLSRNIQIDEILD